MISRRAFLSHGAGLGVCLALPWSATTTRADAPAVRQLTAQFGEAHLLEAGEPRTPIWGYDGMNPGPELRMVQGEPFAADLVNRLPQATTIHWHGIRNDNAMDGVANLTQPATEPGETFAYRFTPPDAGTYWYHPHNRTWEQMARGLYGVFIVEEPSSPDVDQDLVLVFDDWRLQDDGRIHESSFGNLHDVSHAGRLGNVLTLNGHFEQDLPVVSGQRVRLRLVNTANARIMAVSFAAHECTVIALDGYPLSQPYKPEDARVVLAPSQRADVIVDCDQPEGTLAPIHVDTGRERLKLGHLAYAEDQRRRPRTPASPVALPPNPMPTKLDPDRAVEIDVEMAGGAMSAFSSASYKGREYGIRELARTHGKVWALNGIVGMPEAPIAVIERGRTALFRLVNRTAWPHAMHFHGHHVREVSHSGREPLPHWRDTILINRQEEVSVAFQAHNPGRWMLHCHMLAHQAGGMSTWYEVA